MAMKTLNKKYLACISLVCCITSNIVFAEAVRLSEPVAANTQAETFGEPLDTSVNKVTLAQLSQTPVAFTKSTFLLSVPIAKVCQKKGCFFIASDGQYQMRVAFDNYSFFIPTDSSGKTVTLNGKLVAVERSEEQAAHFNKDTGGKAQTLHAGTTYEINASSVQIPKG
ncbi:DUF4920 domain-containing protein [Alteromonas sp. ASW11-130]|uniref:DUF4920 domain-containing protein n=1 Tax=Alteromonas sp. ASW11-130 TaxID=3015775 RepID=UPI0022422405|nr:DUF4920 domain-containing protein [Alteromonas sp. ASW11-130]MCW8093252.1 DUF4920 domain-containing protein [Alteromonas sp. ASW11-130]